MQTDTQDWARHVCMTCLTSCYHLFLGISQTEHQSLSATLVTASFDADKLVSTDSDFTIGRCLLLQDPITAHTWYSKLCVTVFSAVVPVLPSCLLQIWVVLQ